MNGQQALYYVLIILIYFGVDVIAVWGFNLQYGTTRVVNLGYILCQAAGAYIAGVLYIGSPLAGSGETYILGAHLPFPLPQLGGAVAGGVIGFLLGVTVVRRLRQEYVAIVTVVIAVGMVSVVDAAQGIFNGAAGISGVPLPFTGATARTSGYVILLGVTAGGVAISYWIVRSVDRAPLSRTLRAVRDNDVTAASVGINPFALRLLVMTLGGVLAGLSGSLLVSAVGAWSPQSWSIFEVLVLLTAVVIGGPGNLMGSALGALLVPIVIGQGILFLPAIGGNPTINANLQLVITGLVEVAAFLVVPEGLIRERKRRFSLSEGGGVGRVAAAVGDGGEGQQPPSGEVRLGRRARLQGAAAATGLDGATPELVAEGIDVEIGTVSILRDCSLTVTDAVTFLIGPNGAGKSTLLAALAGGIETKKGSVRLGGKKLSGSGYRRARLGLGRTFQVPQEFTTMTVLENVLVAMPGQRGTKFWRAVAGPMGWRAQEAEYAARGMQLLAVCGLEEMANARAGTLSGGQRKLLELARTLATEPKFVLLDEPFAGVSPFLISEMRDSIEAAVMKGTQFLIVAHDMAMVRDFSDSVIVMADGRILAQGTYDEVASRQDVERAFLR